MDIGCHSNGYLSAIQGSGVFFHRTNTSAQSVFQHENAFRHLESQSLKSDSTILSLNLLINISTALLFNFKHSKHPPK